MPRLQGPLTCGIKSKLGGFDSEQGRPQPGLTGARSGPGPVAWFPTLEEVWRHTIAYNFPETIKDIQTMEEGKSRSWTPCVPALGLGLGSRGSGERRNPLCPSLLLSAPSLSGNSGFRHQGAQPGRAGRKVGAVGQEAGAGRGAGRRWRVRQAVLPRWSVTRAPDVSPEAAGRLSEAGRCVYGAPPGRAVSSPGVGQKTSAGGMGGERGRARKGVGR